MAKNGRSFFHPARKEGGRGGRRKRKGGMAKLGKPSYVFYISQERSPFKETTMGGKRGKRVSSSIGLVKLAEERGEGDGAIDSLPPILFTMCEGTFLSKGEGRMGIDEGGKDSRAGVEYEREKTQDGT